MIAKDKILHLAGGTVAAVLCALAGYPMLSVLAGCVAGAGKEGFDYISNKLAARKGIVPTHTVDKMDFAYSVIPGLLISLAYGFISGF